MDSSEVQKEDKFAAIGKRNKVVIIIFFSLIIVVAVITGQMITSLVQTINSESLEPNPAVVEFCSSFVFRSDCIDSLSSAIKPPPDADPSQVFLLSLEYSLSKISDIISLTQSEPALSKCSSSLSHAASQLSNILEILRVDPDVESYDRRNMTGWIGAAAEDLAACAESAAHVSAMVGYSKDYLEKCEVVNEQFRWSAAYSTSRSWEDEVVENFMTVTLFGSQYLLLIFLFCLLLRIY